jgi:hypothetical protein
MKYKYYLRDTTSPRKLEIISTMYGTVNSVKGTDAEYLKMPPYIKDEYGLSSETGFIFLQNAHFTLKPASQKMKFLLCHRLNMELDTQNLFGLHVQCCAQQYSLAETLQPPPPRIWAYIREGAIGQPDDISL